MTFLIRAFRLTLHSWRLGLWLYGITFLLSLLVLLPAYTVLKQQAGHSLAYLNLLPSFDFTVYSDFMRENGRSVDPLLSVGRWLGVFFTVISLFLSGGILTRLSSTPASSPFQIGPFMTDCVRYVGRFARLLFLIIPFSLLWATIWVILGSLAIYLASDSMNEQELFYLVAGIFLLFFIPVTFLLCASDYAKVSLVQADGQSVWRALRQALRFVWRHGRIAYGAYVLLLLAGLGCFGVYFLLDAVIPAGGWPQLLLLFILQQLFIFLRILLKLWTLATAVEVSGRLLYRETAAVE